MQVVPFTAKRSRTQHRHQLRTLTYVTLDEGNGGIVRNLSDKGLAVQMVAPLRPGQQVRVRFELRGPRLPVEARGEVSWAHSSGQAGIRFLDLPPKKIRQVNEWIFGDLLEMFPQPPSRSGGLFEVSPGSVADARLADGLLISPSPPKVIQLDTASANAFPAHADQRPTDGTLDLDWLSRPLSGTALALVIDTLVVFAATLLFFLVFFSVSIELPEWPMNVGLGLATAVFVGAFYWGLFHALAGTTLGASLARLAESDFAGEEEIEKSPRFR
jgi:PilZ domain-containing protein